jgi:hypothetical protein
MNKEFIAHVFEGKGGKKHAILHNLNIMDEKFDALYREVFNFEITINNQVDSQGNDMEYNDQFYAYEDTPSNPIALDEDIEEKIHKHFYLKKEHGPSV